MKNLSFTEMLYKQKSLELSQIVSKHGFHVPFMGNYKSFAVYHTDGTPVLLLDSNFKLLVNTLNIHEVDTKEIYDDIFNEISKLDMSFIGVLMRHCINTK